jgi:hypothetical protein
MFIVAAMLSVMGSMLLALWVKEPRAIRHAAEE